MKIIWTECEPYSLNETDSNVSSPIRTTAKTSLFLNIPSDTSIAALPCEQCCWQDQTIETHSMELHHSRCSHFFQQITSTRSRCRVLPLSSHKWESPLFKMEATLGSLGQGAKLGKLNCLVNLIDFLKGCLMIILENWDCSNCVRDFCLFGDRQLLGRMAVKILDYICTYFVPPDTEINLSVLYKALSKRPNSLHKSWNLMHNATIGTWGFPKGTMRSYFNEDCRFLMMWLLLTFIHSLHG